MAPPTKAELDARATELDRREAAINAAEQNIKTREAECADREQGTAGREDELNELAERLAEREAAIATLADARTEPAGVTYNTLPEPRAGHGFVVVEAPLELVTVYANLHPSERATVAAQTAGAMRQTLMETGKLRVRRPRAGTIIDEAPAPAEVTLAVVAADPEPAGTVR